MNGRRSKGGRVVRGGGGRRREGQKSKGAEKKIKETS